MPDPILPIIDNIPPEEALSVSRGKIMSNYGELSAAATTSTAGLIELADQSEINVGTDDCRAVTPSGLVTYVAANSGDWNSNAFTDLTDVNVSPFVVGDIGAIPTVVSAGPGLFQLELEQTVFTVQDSQVCLNHDYAGVDTNFLLPAIATETSASIAVVRAGATTTVTLSPSGGDTIQGVAGPYISNNINDDYSTIFLRAINFNWTIMFGVGEWKPVTTEPIPGNDLPATPRYCTDGAVTSAPSPVLNERSYITEEYSSIDPVPGYNITQNAWTPRKINTTTSDPLSLITSLASNRFGLNAGTYRVVVNVSHAIQHSIGSQIIFRLRTTTNETLGNVSPTKGSENWGAYAETDITSFTTSFTINSSKLIELQQFITGNTINIIDSVTAQALPISYGEPKILAQIEIEKIS
jgi:hypothetical protein